jgi:magnesium chelatase family protein
MFNQKVVVNLLPAEQKKSGPLFDLAMAITALKELNVIKSEIPIDTAFMGALSLDGMVVKAEGMLPALIAAKSLGIKRVYLPNDPAIPIHMLHGLECIIVHHIEEVVQHLEGQESLSFLPKPQSIDQMPLFSDTLQKDFCHVIGHEHAKRALEIAAARVHNVLMSGPPAVAKACWQKPFLILPAYLN